MRTQNGYISSQKLLYTNMNRDLEGFRDLEVYQGLSLIWIRWKFIKKNADLVFIVKPLSCSRIFCDFPQNFHTRESGEITLFFGVRADGIKNKIGQFLSHLYM